MIPVAEYLLKVILCTGVLTGYYWIALRNKLFHQWNRFYLLASLFIAVLLPFVQFTLWHQQQEETQPAYQMLQTITTGENWFEAPETAPKTASSVFTIENVSIVLYMLVSLFIFCGFLFAVARIFRIYKSYQHWKLEQLVFVDTDAKGTPFSFFQYIFWNRKIPLDSAQGQQIFAHELIHVKEKHSWDKLFINLLLVVFWINPFFWIIRKELTMIHEFIADRKSLKDGDTASFAAMILAAAYPGYTLPLSNPFFYSPLKRRLLMLNRLNTPKVGYISRLLLLPLLTLLFVAFAVKVKSINNDSITKLTKPFIVVIDAGHGYQQNGSIHGSRGVNGATEDDLCLSIAKKFEHLNTDKNLKLIFTRPDKNFIDLKERIKIAEESKADLFISIHTNIAPRIKQGNTYAENPMNGFELYTPPADHTQFSKSVDIGSAIVNEMKTIIALKENPIKQRKVGVYVLTASPCPAVLLECGFISNKKDAEFLSDENNQEKIAKAVLKAIDSYVNEKSIQPTIQKDSLPQIFKGGITMLGTYDCLFLYDSILENRNEVYQYYYLPAIIINGKLATLKQLKGKTYHAKFAEFYPANDAETIKKFGSAAITGIQVFYEVKEIERPLNLKEQTSKNQLENMVFTKAEKEPVFPGGEQGWNQYIQSSLTKETSINKGEFCEIEFIITDEGAIKSVRKIKASSDKMSEVCIAAVIKSPKWKPASQNGRDVDFIIQKKITF